MAEPYVIRFVDDTASGGMSSFSIRTGAGEFGEGGDSIATGAGVISSAGGKIMQQAERKFISQPLNQATGGLARPAISLVRVIAGGASAAALAGVGAMIAWKGVELLIKSINERIERLETEAREQNNNDNALISAGLLNVYGATVSYGKYGRAEYRLDRS